MAEQKFTTEELESEEWRAVLGYETYYSVSDLGRIRRDRDSTNTSAGRILSARCPSSRYIRITLCKNNQPRLLSMHQLVADAFVYGPKPLRPEVNHKDGHKRNNRAGNLEWTTRKGNAEHASRLGLLADGARNGIQQHPEKAQGAANGMAILTKEKVIEMIGRYDKGERLETLSNETGRSKAYLCLVLNGYHWHSVHKQLGRPCRNSPSKRLSRIQSN